jgi:hypothetical protein
MKWCERCGGPVRSARHDPEGYSHKGCRLCGLDRWTSADVWDDALTRHAVDAIRDRRLPDARVPWEATWREWSGQRDAANSPCPHASGWWLPEGADDSNVRGVPGRRHPRHYDDEIMWAAWWESRGFWYGGGPVAMANDDR